MSGDPSRSRVRIVHAMIAIRSARTKGDAITDDAVAQRHGYRDAAELVGAMLEETMPASRAVMLIETFHLGPWPQESGVLSIRFRVEAELRKAIDAGEPWIRPKRTIDDGAISSLLDQYLVEPRGMIEWFLAATARRGFIAPVFPAALGGTLPMIEMERAITGPKPGIQGSQARAYAEAQAILAAGEAPRTKRALAQMVKDRLGIPHKRDSVERWLSDLDITTTPTRKP